MKADVLSEVILSGPFLKESIAGRLMGVGCDRRFCHGVLKDLLMAFGEGGRPSVGAVKEFLEGNQRYLRKREKGWELRGVSFEGAEMGPDLRRSAGWRVPSITSSGSLARWLEVDPQKLDLFAGRNGLVDVGSKLSHYVLERVMKRSGGYRLLEKPKMELKRMQRCVLDGILNHIPAHDCSHGFQRGRSIFSFVRPHVGRRLVIKVDLRDYFLSVGGGRVRSLFHLAGYPPRVSDALMGLCVNRLGRRDVMDGLVDAWRYEVRHLPQGAPSSPALADRVLFMMDVRLAALAERMGMRYGRYADDMAFSTDEVGMGGGRVERFLELVYGIVGEEGFRVNEGKTRVMDRSQRQRLAGLVVNEGANVERGEYEVLKAILYRCGVNGLEAENREGHPEFLAHLRGRVEFVRQGNEGRGERLFGMLGEIY